MECVRRKRAGVLEYRPHALDELQTHLHAELATVVAERAALRPAATMAKQARRQCHRLAGSISMAELALPTTARMHPPPPPPPPPVCWRGSVYVEVCRMQRRALALHASAHHGALTSPQVCRKARMQRRALSLAISLAAKQVEAEAVEAATAAAAALAGEQASPPWAHPAQGTIATPLLQSSRPLKGHLGELRALLCLAPAAIQLPLQPAHVRRAAEALGYDLKPSCPPSMQVLTTTPSLPCIGTL